MIEFLKLRPEHLEQVLKWRTSEDVTKYMYTDIPYNMENQRNWYERIKDSITERYWIVTIKGQPAGLVSLNEINAQHKRSTWGYYIGEAQYRMYGGLVPPYLYNYVFMELGYHKLTAEVMCGNENVIKLHKMHGYHVVGICAEHIYKNGQFHDIMIMELMKERWLNEMQKFHKYKAYFEE